MEGIGRSVELKEVLRKCVEAAKIVMNAEASSLMLLDELTGDLNVSIPTGPVKDEIMGMSVPKSKGIGGWVISYNQPFISNDVVESDIFWKDLSTGFVTRNIICVPLQNSDGEAFGVLQAINKKAGAPFENKDVPVFESLALHVASAIERSQMFDEMEQKLAEKHIKLTERQVKLKYSLRKISQLLTLDADEIPDPGSRRMLTIANSRIRSVAEAHTILFEQHHSKTVNLSQHLAKIANNTEAVFKSSDNAIRLSVHMEDLELDSIRAVICGFILNELLIKAYEYVFLKDGMCEVIVRLKKTQNGKIVLIVTDKGIGLKQKSQKNGKLSDVELIMISLAENLNGVLSFTKNVENGSISTLSFMA